MASTISFGDATINHGLQACIINGPVSTSFHLPRAREEILNSLPTAKNAPFNAYQRQHDPICLTGTRVSLLQEIQDWGDGVDSVGIFWLGGMAGTGKSTIAKTIAADYDAKGRLAASFFFSRAGEDTKNAGKFVTTIAYQLAKSIPVLKPKICDAISNNKDISSQSLDSQWQELIITSLSNLKQERRESKYIIVVDALDECDDQDDVHIILQCLSELQSLHPIRLQVFVTGRPDSAIRCGLNNLGRDRYKDIMLHEINHSIMENDISVFLRCQLELIRQRFALKDSWPDEKMITRLVQNSGSLFIWAATACRFIGEDYELADSRLLRFAETNNRTLPSDQKLDEIYSTVLANSIRTIHIYTKEEIQTKQERFREVVGALAILQTPLSVASLAELLGKSVESLQITLSNLHSVLRVPTSESNVIRFLHPSFRDFLLDHNRCGKPQFRIDEPLVHREIYLHCLRVLKKHLRRDICNLRHPASCAADLSKAKVDQHIKPHVQYACKFWVYHYGKSQMFSSESSSIMDFFQNDFLHYLEALALLGCIDHAYYMIHVLDAPFSNLTIPQPGSRSHAQSGLSHKLISKIRSGLSRNTSHVASASPDMNIPNLQDIVYDATRFVLTFGPIFTEAPLQVYYAGLMFSPNKSIVRKTFVGEMKTWLLSVPKIAEDWSLCLRTFKGHMGSVNTVAFSPTNKDTVASGSDDHTIILWDISTGKMLRTLRGHSGQVNAVAFSPDGQILASASNDKTVILWDTSQVGYKILYTLTSHVAAVNAIAFSSVSSGMILATASSDHLVRLWDVKSGELLQTLDPGSSSPIRHLFFSISGQILGLIPDRGRPRLLNTKSRAMVVLKNRDHLFKSCNKYLGCPEDPSGQWEDSSLRLLAANDASQLTGTNFIIAPDGQTFVVASEEALILRNFGDNGHVQLRGHLKDVKAMMFSSNSRLLISASIDHTLNLWDVGLANGLKKRSVTQIFSSMIPSSDLKTLTGLSFSPDAKTLISAYMDGSIILWDTYSKKASLTLKGHLSQIRCLAVSQYGNMLVSVCTDRIIIIWDAQSGKLLRKLKGQSSGSVEALAISQDGKKLASSYNDGTIQLWDTSSGKMLQTIKVDTTVERLSFFNGDSCLKTERGVLDILNLHSGLRGLTQSTSQSPLLMPPPIVTVQDDWICWNREKVVRIPSEYQPQQIATSNGIVALACADGQILTFQLDFEGQNFA